MSITKRCNVPERERPIASSGARVCRASLKAAASLKTYFFEVSLNTDLLGRCEHRGARRYCALLNAATSLNVDFPAVSLDVDFS